VIVPWTIGDLLRNLAGREDHPAVVAFSEKEVVHGPEKPCREGAGVARNLREAGFCGDVAVALWAPNLLFRRSVAQSVWALGEELPRMRRLNDATNAPPPANDWRRAPAIVSHGQLRPRSLTQALISTPGGFPLITSSLPMSVS
jgi:hypothetical protein